MESARAVIASAKNKMNRMFLLKVSPNTGFANSVTVWVKIFMLRLFKGSDTINCRSYRMIGLNVGLKIWILAGNWIKIRGLFERNDWNSVKLFIQIRICNSKSTNVSFFIL